jgi:hypothetical protein
VSTNKKSVSEGLNEKTLKWNIYIPSICLSSQKNWDLDSERIDSRDWNWEIKKSSLVFWAGFAHSGWGEWEH